MRSLSPGLYLGAPDGLLYWSGVALVLFWIVVGTVWLFRQAPGRRPPRTCFTDRPAEQGPEDGADQDRENKNEGGNERHETGPVVATSKVRTLPMSRGRTKRRLRCLVGRGRRSLEKEEGDEPDPGTGHNG